MHLGLQAACLLPSQLLVALIQLLGIQHRTACKLNLCKVRMEFLMSFQQISHWTSAEVVTSSFSTFQSPGIPPTVIFWSFVEEYQFAVIVRFKFEHVGFPNPRSYLALHDSELERRRAWLTTMVCGSCYALCQGTWKPFFHAAVTLAFSFHLNLWEMSA